MLGEQSEELLEVTKLILRGYRGEIAGAILEAAQKEREDMERRFADALYPMSCRIDQLKGLIEQGQVDCLQYETKLSSIACDLIEPQGWLSHGLSHHREVVQKQLLQQNKT